MFAGPTWDYLKYLKSNGITFRRISQSPLSQQLHSLSYQSTWTAVSCLCGQWRTHLHPRVSWSPVPWSALICPSLRTRITHSHPALCRWFPPWCFRSVSATPLWVQWFGQSQRLFSLWMDSEYLNKYWNRILLLVVHGSDQLFRKGLENGVELVEAKSTLLFSKLVKYSFQRFLGSAWVLVDEL